MTGFYDYTVILTYASLVSAVTGMALAIDKHPILATLCLLFCGLCDMFDGKVARSKKNRTEMEKSFGIQIDSLSDVVAFGVLPAVIAITLCDHRWYVWVVAALYVLAGLIRLAYFNVTEELRQKDSSDPRKSYTGLPITSAALIFPLFYCSISVYCLAAHEIEHFARLFRTNTYTLILTALLALTALAFLSPFRVRKPRSRELYLFLAIGIVLAGILGVTFLLANGG